jgi:hypothetical protein
MGINVSKSPDVNPVYVKVVWICEQPVRTCHLHWIINCSWSTASTRQLLILPSHRSIYIVFYIRWSLRIRIWQLLYKNGVKELSSIMPRGFFLIWVEKLQLYTQYNEDIYWWALIYFLFCFIVPSAYLLSIRIVWYAHKHCSCLQCQHEYVYAILRIKNRIYIYYFPSLPNTRYISWNCKSKTYLNSKLDSHTKGELIPMHM